MLLDGFPQYGNTRWEVFTSPQGQWIPWLKPIGAQWLWILAVGGAGGGGGGGSTAGSARTGGGGGAAASSIRLMIPAFLLPDVLYVRPGNGGAGGTAAGNGTGGNTTYVGPAPGETNAVILTASAGGGGATAATGGTASSSSATWWGLLGIYVGATGVTGNAGGANTGAAGVGNVPQNNQTLTQPGSGGASSSTGNNVFAGGNQGGYNPATGTVFWPTIVGGAVGISGSQAGGAGPNGYNFGVPIIEMMSRNQPFILGGGSGGGSGGASLGGKGGDGAWGCGGGGGGAGSTGGVGGKGGDGFVIIGAF